MERKEKMRRRRRKERGKWGGGEGEKGENGEEKKERKRKMGRKRMATERDKTEIRIVAETRIERENEGVKCIKH